MEPEKLFAERFTELIKNSNLTLEEIGNQIGIKSKSTISKYASGEIKNVKKSLIVKIAKIFNVSPAWLCGLSDEKYITKLNTLENKTVPIPLIGTLKFGYNILDKENILGYEDISEELFKTGEFFALNVKGNSMADAILEGDTIIVKKQNDFENGDIVVVLINGNEETIKKIKKTNNGILLQSFNTQYEPLIFSNEEIKNIPVKIIGVVKELKRHF